MGSHGGNRHESSAGGYDLAAYVRYVRDYPDVLDRLLSLWHVFDLSGLKDFLHRLDLKSPYVAPPLSHRRYTESREEIIRIVRSRDGSAADGAPAGHYLNRHDVRRVYSASAAGYDRIWDSVWSYEDREQVIQALRLLPGDRLLEVGIGTGNNVKHFPGGCRVTGIDSSREMLARCARKLQDSCLDNVRLAETDAHDLPFEDAAFDKALCFYTLCCVEDPARVLAEVARVCVPGGRVVVYDVVRSDIPEVALLQHIYRPIARDLGAVYLEFCPPHNITYDSCLDLDAAVSAARLKTRQVTFLDPFRTVALGVYERV